MSEYSVRKYIEKKIDDIYKDTPITKAYDLGVAVGMYQAYKYLKLGLGKDVADKCFSNLSENDNYTTVLRTLIKLDEKESVSLAEKMLEHYKQIKKPNVIMSDEHRELLEEFMEFLYKREKWFEIFRKGKLYSLAGLLEKFNNELKREEVLPWDRGNKDKITGI